MTQPIAYAISTMCPDCGRSLAIRKRNRDGESFVSCTGFPSCKYAGSIDETLDRMQGRIDRIISRSKKLEDEMNKLRFAQDPRSGLENILRDLIFKFHPDRNPAKLEPGNVVRELIAVRAEYVEAQR